jgi:epoxyqueuosine reductase
MEPEARQLESWLNAGNNARLDYMANHFDKRVDPTKLVPGAKTVVVLGFNYYPADETPSLEAPKVARYAYGEDYHYVVKRRGKELMKQLQEQYGAIEGRVFVDSAPVLERQWAQRTGQGWLGKNTLLLRRDMGSYFFLCELIIDLAFEPDGPMDDFCGTCTKCIDACPTDAIAPNGYLLDAGKCISYLTIELKESIDDSFRQNMEGWAFGCDICQEVCPWNRFSKPHTDSELQAYPELASLDEKAWLEMTTESFQKVFKKSPLKRKGLPGIQQTISFIKKSD